MRILMVLVMGLSMNGCLLVAAANYATHDVECEAIFSDEERGVKTTAWNQAKCDKLKQDSAEDARRIIERAERVPPTQDEIDRAKRILDQAEKGNR